MLTDVAFVAVHVRVAVAPAVMLAGLAVKRTVGIAGGAGEGGAGETGGGDGGVDAGVDGGGAAAPPPGVFAVGVGDDGAGEGVVAKCKVGFDPQPAISPAASAIRDAKPNLNVSLLGHAHRKR